MDQQESAALAQAIPTSLDCIITGAGREIAQLRLGTAADLDFLAMPVQAPYVKDDLDQWRLICLAVRAKPPLYFLVGYAARAGTVWSTSQVHGIDPDQQLAATNRSTYKLLEPGAGEPDFHQRLHICAALRHWGLGTQLGVPDVFY